MLKSFWHRWLLGSTLLRACIVLSIHSACASGDWQKWQEGSRESAGIASEVVASGDSFSVYCARAFSWRWLFAVHCWIAYRHAGEQNYHVVHMMGRLAGIGKPGLLRKSDIPDRYWFGSRPYRIIHLKDQDGALTPALQRLPQIIRQYPFATQYRAWPGPNSNTFVAYVLRELGLSSINLPPNAIGKDYLPWSQPFAWTTTRTGITFSVEGLLGFECGVGDGVSVQLLGMQVGLDVWPPALLLPFIGRLGFPDAPLDGG